MYFHACVNAHLTVSFTQAPKENKRGAPPPTPQETLGTFRKQPVGSDAQLRRYFFVDFMESAHHPLLYREGKPVPQPLLPEPEVEAPAPSPVGKKRGRGAKVCTLVDMLSTSVTHVSMIMVVLLSTCV